jgi:hypothetical protein
MRSRRIGRGLMVCAALCGLYGVADAQTAPARTTDMAVEAQRQTRLSPQEQVQQGSASLTKISMTGTNVRRMLEQARAQRDVVKTLCLNDKLNQIDVAARSARERQNALEAAAGRNDAAMASHEFTIVTVLRQRVEQIGFEANQCVGAETGFVGATTVSTRIDPGEPNEDPSVFPAAEGIVTLPPVCVSCTY